MKLSAKIEALLFASGESMRAKELGDILEASSDEIHSALSELERMLSERGIRLMRKDDTVQLATAPEMSSIIEKRKKEELQKDLGKAAVETLAIVLYRGPIAKADIDYIRGVNSAAILRSLLVRGLVERVPNPKMKRSFLYRPTFDILSYLGVEQAERLPEYAEAQKQLNEFQSAAPEHEE